MNCSPRRLEMEPLIVQQRAAMDAFDPQRRIGLIVDEWGTWHPVEARHEHRVSVAAEHVARCAGRRAPRSTSSIATPTRW